MRPLRHDRFGFTLVEMMIVVLIIAILLAIAIPNFLRSREISRATTCQATLRQIDTAKEHWGMENSKASTDTPTSADLVTEYMRARYEDVLPACASGGSYTVGDMATLPVCTIGANGSGTSDDHIIK